MGEDKKIVLRVKTFLLFRPIGPTRESETMDQRAMHFIIVVEGFMDIITMN